MSEQFGAVVHAHQPGWFDLVSVMIDGMLANAGQEEAEAFLYSMGDTLAQRYPLAEALTVQDLEREMNLQLVRFQWGFVQLQPLDDAILLKHHALPAGDNTLDPASWQAALAAMFGGLYAGWLHAQGGKAAMPVRLELNDGNTLHYRY